MQLKNSEQVLYGLALQIIHTKTPNETKSLQAKSSWVQATYSSRWKSTKTFSTSLSEKKANPWDQPGVFKLLKAKDYPKESVKIRKIEEKNLFWIKYLSYLKIQRNHITQSEAQPYTHTQVLLKAWLLSGKSWSEQRLTLGTRVWGERGGAPHLPEEIPAGAQAPTEKPSFGKHGIHMQSKAQADKQAHSIAGCSLSMLPSAWLHPCRAVAARRTACLPFPCCGAQQQQAALCREETAPSPKKHLCGRGQGGGQARGQN